MSPKRRRGGQHMERDARYQMTGMTTPVRDTEITRLRERGLSQQAIADKLGLTQPAVHYALKRLRGEARNRTLYDVCEWCAQNVPKGTLDVNGSCQACAQM